MDETKVKEYILDETHEGNIAALKETLGLRPNQDLSEFEFKEDEEEEN